MNKVNSLHRVKEHPKISNFLQFESQRSKTRAISDLRDLHGNKAFQPRLHVLHTLLSSNDSSRNPSTTLKLYRNTNLDGVF